MLLLQKTSLSSSIMRHLPGSPDEVTWAASRYSASFISDLRTTSIPAQSLPRMRGPLFRTTCRALPRRPSWSGPVSLRGLSGIHNPSCRPIPGPRPVRGSDAGRIRSFTSSTPVQFVPDGDSTIYALSTAPGRAAIAVVRISGPACVKVRAVLRAF